MRRLSLRGTLADMDEFQSLRPYLFSIAYRMLGSAMDSEDTVQDAYLRWAAADRESVRSPKAFLATIVTRLCINRLTSARADRESYVGVWLPEPLLTAIDPLWSSPEAEVGSRESLSLAFMLLLESLSPDERAVFVLRSVFDYDYAEIAEIVGKSSAACRQMFHRAREKVADARAADAPHADALARLAASLTAAFERGDLATMSGLLTEDVTSMADGGGKVRGAGLRPVRGIAAVTAVLKQVLIRGRELGAVPELAEVNGVPGFVTRVDGSIFSVTVLELRDGKISRMMFVANPDKLRHANNVAGEGGRY